MEMFTSHDTTISNDTTHQNCELAKFQTMPIAILYWFTSDKVSKANTM